MIFPSMAPAPPPSLLSHPSSSLTLGLHPLPLLPAPPARDLSGHHLVEHVAPPVAKVKLVDITPYEGAADGVYWKAMEEPSGSLKRHNSVLIELGSDKAGILKRGLRWIFFFF